MAMTTAILFGLAHVVLAGETVELETENGSLHGAVELPSGDGPWPLALIIAGSGPTDRDGNNPLAGVNNHLKMLAEALANEGVASLRFDKRGIGESAEAAPDESDMRFEILVQDAVLWGNRLCDDARFGGLYVIGHSEGSLVGIMASHELKPNGLISLCGTGARAGNLLRDQIESEFKPPLRDRSLEIIDQLEQGETVTDVPPALTILFRPSVQPYLISWFKIDPVEEMRKFCCPALVVGGTTDIQVSERHAALLAGAREDITFHQVEGMNHVLKMVPDNRLLQRVSYFTPDLPVSEELVKVVSEFVQAVERSTAR
jgi:uncharacterized protein